MGRRDYTLLTLFRGGSAQGHVRLLYKYHFDVSYIYFFTYLDEHVMRTKMSYVLTFYNSNVLTFYNSNPSVHFVKNLR